ncbi:hypothetical protein T484DRAFT_1743026 [Baffinella frigidus]|nr:hypothetical protein T484DRAFT_1743026 [Cryptophyta sp. CCMP2293]
MTVRERMQDSAPKGLRGAQPRTLKLAGQAPISPANVPAEPSLFRESSAASAVGKPPTAMRFSPQDVLHPGEEDTQHLAMDRLKLEEPLVRRWDALRQLDWLDEMLRRPPPPGMHMIQIAAHLLGKDRKNIRRISVDGHDSSEPSRPRSRSPEVVDRKALATENKLPATASPLRRTVARVRAVQLLHRPRFEQDEHELERQRTEPRAARKLSLPLGAPSPATLQRAPSCELPLLRTASGTELPFPKAVTLRRA